jgi:hypothetical protein
MSDPIQAAIEVAKAVAVTAPAPATGLPARGTPFSLADFAIGAMNVDAYLKVKEFGLIIGNSNVLIPEVTAVIDMTTVQVTQCIKFGDPAQYLKSYDGISCTTGGSWESAILRVRQIEPSARPYDSADIPMTVSEDIKTSDDKTVLLDAGKQLGHSLSTTNKRNFKDFIAAVRNAGLIDIPVKVKISAQRRTNKKGQVWGVLAFELLGAALAS